MKLLALLITSVLLFTSSQAYSRDTKHLNSIQEAMQSATFKEKLDPTIRFYFGDQKHPKVIRSYGNFSTNKKTNAFNKSDEEACKWVLLSGLITLQERANREGGNAIINVASYYKKNTYKSKTKYECHAGTFLAGVALTGEVVKLAK
ncbi:MAG: excinuclease ATPase subunit [Gammaproteobacteria bacterium]|nr:MAG: excinuclease ATPase subunit [Gammaproteobacteria bacterium]